MKNSISKPFLILVFALIVNNSFAQIRVPRIVPKSEVTIDLKTESLEVNKASIACNCVAPPPYYVKEYPSSGNTLSIANGWPAYIPVSALSSGNTIHFGFAVNPCLSSISNPCTGYYRAIVNGHTINSIGTGGNNHIQIPINYFVAGANTIKLQGVCGITTCALTSSIVNIGNPPLSSGTITLTKECCTVSNHIPPYATHSTGKVKFKMAGVVANSVLEITSATGTSYETFINGSYTACYTKPVTVKLVNNLTHAPAAGSTVNGLSIFTYSGWKFECLIVKELAVTIDKNLLHAFVPENPFDQAEKWELDDFNGLRLTGKGTDKDGGDIQIVASVDINQEDGRLFLTGTPKIMKTSNGKTIAIKSKFVPTKKHNYVGHVTLLR